MIGSTPSRDAETRSLERTGSVDLAGKLRKDELPAYTSAREVGGLLSKPVGDTGFRLVRPGRVAADPMDAIRILAFASLPEARAMVEPSSLPFDNPLGDWLGGLQRLWTKLPPHDSGVPAERWGMVVVACAVARECWPVEAARIAEERRGPLTARLVRPVLDALDAAERWIAEPTQERLKAWQGPWLGWPHERSQRPLWLPSPPGWPQDWAPGLLAAADVIGADRVREVASAAVVKAVLG